MQVNFGHLAGCAAFNIFGDKGFHVWPPVVRCDELEGFGDSRVTGGYLIMEKGNYSPPKLVVCHDNQGGPIMPVGTI